MYKDKNYNPIEIHGFENNSIAAMEASGLSKCFDFYADHFAGYDIMEIGFNPNSGYVYIALEGENVTICSAFGKAVELLVTNFEDGEEIFFDTYDEWDTWLDKGGFDGDKWDNYTILTPDDLDIDNTNANEHVVLAVQNINDDDVVLVLYKDKNRPEGKNWTWNYHADYCSSTSDFVYKELEKWEWGFDSNGDNYWFNFNTAMLSTKEMCRLTQQTIIDLTQYVGDENV